MIQLVTIGGGNGHSHLLKALKTSEIYSDINLQAIVSMSDDGRTTGKLMRHFYSEFGKHLPPPGDLRRCLYVLSESEYVDELQDLLEQIIDIPGKICDYTMEELVGELKVSKDLGSYLVSKNSYFLNFRLDINKKIQGHKFGNILMACLYKNFLYDYNYMIRFMHDLLETHAKIIPVTTDSAYIEAVLEDGTVVKKQDNISNAIEYTGKIKSLRLMEESQGAKHNFKIDDAILQAEYIILSPGDLFTSNISNLIIGGINSLLRKSNAKIICVGNTTNKGGETAEYSVLDFVNTLEQYLGKQIDIFLANNKRVELDEKALDIFKQDISVKGGDYIYLSLADKVYLQSRSTRVLEADLLDEKALYKHDIEKLAKELSKIII